MTPLIIAACLALIGITLDAYITRLAAKHALDATLNWYQGYALVLGRTAVALIGGFTVGSILAFFVGGDVTPELENIIGSLIMSVISFIFYWWMMRSATHKNISFFQMIKTLFTELGYLLIIASGIAVAIIVCALISSLLK